MKTAFAKLTVSVFVFSLLLSCSSVTPENQLSPDERADRIIEAVRNSSSKGFLDIGISHKKSDLYISGHTYSSAYVASLMRSATIDKYSSLQLIEMHREIYKGVQTVAFQLVVPGIGIIQSWSEPISIEYLPSTNMAEISGDMLHLYSYYKYEYIGVVGTGIQKKALIRTIDGRLLSLTVGTTIGSEHFAITEINDTALILVDSNNVQHVLRKTIVITEKGVQQLQ